LSLLNTDLNTFYIDIYYQFSLLKFDGPIYLYRVYFRFYGNVRVAHRFSFLCCPIMCRYVLSSVLWCPLRIRIKTMFGSSLPTVVCRRVHVLFTLFVFACAQWCPTYIVLCCVCLRIVYPILPVSLDCQFLIVLRYSLTFIY
jgi:hypothetical protein